MYVDRRGPPEMPKRIFFKKKLKIDLRKENLLVISPLLREEQSKVFLQPDGSTNINRNKPVGGSIV